MKQHSLQVARVRFLLISTRQLLLRRLLASGFLISISILPLKAQSSYHPFLDSTGWLTQFNNFTGTWFTWTNQLGDTVIGSYTYKAFSNGKFYREDTAQRKVYVRGASTTNERLMYDFALGVGDTLRVIGPQVNEVMTVMWIDSVYVLNGYRKRWHFSGPNYNMITIEGIGSPQEPADEVVPGWLDPQWYMTCFYQQGQVVYTRSGTCPAYLDTFAIMVHPATCGQCNGSVTVMHMGNFHPDQISWTNPYIPNGYEIISGLCANTTGTVTVVQSSSSFYYSDFYWIVGLPSPIIQNSSTINPSCSSCCDGSIVESVSSGTAPFSFTWSPNVSTSNSASGLCAGTYIITVRDSSGCVDRDTVVLSFTTTLGISNDSLRMSLYPNPSTGEVQLKGNFPPKSVFHIYDMLGNEIMMPVPISAGEEEMEIQIDLPQGAYFYRIISDNGILAEDRLLIIK